MQQITLLLLSLSLIGLVSVSLAANDHGGAMTSSISFNVHAPPSFPHPVAIERLRYCPPGAFVHYDDFSGRPFIAGVDALGNVRVNDAHARQLAGQLRDWIRRRLGYTEPLPRQELCLGLDRRRRPISRRPPGILNGGGGQLWAARNQTE